MERITKDFEIEIGKIQYQFSIEFTYDEGNSECDPTEQEDAELYSWDFDSEIYAWDTEQEKSYPVDDPKEIKMLTDWIDIEELFYEAIS